MKTDKIMNTLPSYKDLCDRARARSKKMNIFDKIIKGVKWAFNINTGSYIATIHYEYNEKYHKGYAIYKGYRMFGIPGYDKVSPLFLTKEEALKFFNCE